MGTDGGMTRAMVLCVSSITMLCQGLGPCHAGPGIRDFSLSWPMLRHSKRPLWAFSVGANLRIDSVCSCSAVCGLVATIADTSVASFFWVGDGTFDAFDLRRVDFSGPHMAL